MKSPSFLYISLCLIAGCGANNTLKQTTQPMSATEQSEITTGQDTYIQKSAEDMTRLTADSALKHSVEPQLMELSSLPASKRITGQELYVSVEQQEHHNQERYASQQISAIKQTRSEPVSTFSIDVDTASYTNSRRFLLQGLIPPADAIRVEEFINYFDYQLDAPASMDGPVRIETEQMITPWNHNTHLLRVSLQAYRTDINALPPMNLVFLLDVSGSMNSASKLPLLQRSFNMLVDQLRPQDHVSIAVYAGNSGVVLEPTSGDHKAILNNAINNLRAGGGTHGSAGIQLAYDLAQENFIHDGINRIILATDGDFNLGTTNIDTLKNLIEVKREQGVFLSVIGFGQGNYNDHLMEELSNHGNGTAYYIDSYQEARKIFSDQLTSTLQTIAKDVKIQVEFNPEQIAEYRLIGYDNRALKQEDFNNDKIDAGEMGAGHTVTALYEIVLSSQSFRFNDPLRYQPNETENQNRHAEIAFVKARYKIPDENNSQLITIPVSNHLPATASPTMKLTSAAAWFAEQLRHSPYIQSFDKTSLTTLITDSIETDRWGYRHELLHLVQNFYSVSGME
jgi:Ca-activated chloride channel family protein